MKIALVILHADPARGGAERYTVDLAEALARRGHEVSVVASTFAGLPAEVAKAPLAAGGLTRSGAYRRFLDGLDAHLDQAKYDIVHAMLPVRRCNVYHPHAGMAAAASAKLNWYVNPRRRSMARVERRLLAGERPPTVIALSRYVERAILKHYPDLSGRLATLFNAVDLGRFKPAATRPVHRSPSVTALLIANDFERKGVAAALSAVAQVRDTRLRLKVVGKGNVKHYREIAKGLNISGVVDFHGSTPDTIFQYETADFFVLPTKHDPCSLVVLEALVMGLPVISTVYNGATEIMTDGVHGYVLPDPNDVGALADAMRKMLDPEHRRQMSRACLDLRPRLSYDTHLDRLLQIYDDSVR